MDIRIREYINADKELMRKTWNDFYQCIENKKIIVFGASSGAVHLMKEKTLDIAYFVDNAQAKWKSDIKWHTCLQPGTDKRRKYGSYCCADRKCIYQ